MGAVAGFSNRVPGTVAVGNRSTRRCRLENQSTEVCGERETVGRHGLGDYLEAHGGGVRGRLQHRLPEKLVATQASLTEIEQAALAGTEPGLQLEVVMEATGPSWGPVAFFFARRGHRVYGSAQPRRQRCVRRSQERKTNSIDAQTLARLPLVILRGSIPGGHRAEPRQHSTAACEPVHG